MNKAHGFTLIELLLYISIVGTLLLSAVTFAAMSADARVKNQTISEVDQQGMAAMEYLAQTVRNADSITTPAAGATGASLTLAVPTASLSPTIFDLNSSTLGYATAGDTVDSDNRNFINATKFTASASGTTTVLYAYISTVSASPNNLGQMALYGGAASPTALLASSASVTLTPNSWNAFPIASTALTSGQVYWLAYNTNGSAAADNNMRLHTGTANQSMFVARTYGTWPSSWTGTGQSIEFSMYANIDTGSGAAVRVKEGTATAIPLTNNKVQVSGLSFKNLTRSGTPGNLQISFVVSYLNPNNRNEYSYQKTFTTSVSVRP